MMRAPTRAAIYAAELRVAQFRQNTRDSLCSARGALRATLARPSTLALAAGTAGILGFFLARAAGGRRAPVSATSEAAGAGVATKTTAVGMVLAYIVRYAKQSFPFILQQVLAAQRRHTAQADVAMSKLSSTGYSATGVRPLH